MRPREIWVHPIGFVAVEFEISLKSWKYFSISPKFCQSIKYEIITKFHLITCMHKLGVWWSEKFCAVKSKSKVKKAKKT